MSAVTLRVFADGALEPVRETVTDRNVQRGGARRLVPDTRVGAGVSVRRPPGRRRPGPGAAGGDAALEVLRGWRRRIPNPAHGVRSRRSALDSDPLLLLNRWVVPLKRMVAMGAALFMLLALASVSVALHEHDADVQSAGHADCTVCHFRHLSEIATDGTPAPSAPDLVAHPVVSVHPDGERGMALGIRPTRGPPA